MPAETSRRQLTLTLSILALAYHTSTALLLQFLPSEPLHLARSLTLYAVFGALLSLLGLTGTLKRSSLLVAAFANHLLLDALLATIPRLILLTFLSTLPSTICDPAISSFPNPFLPPSTPSLPPGQSPPLLHRRAGGFGSWVEKGWSTPDRCFVVMNTLLGVAAFLAVATGCAQWWCAWRVREFAGLVGRGDWGVGGGEEEGERFEKTDMEDGEWRAVEKV
ncbi:hypothetical protein K490DRAFT_66689 [Saccharata proteae CBS 121410]|uniref:Uncharacterized protein n=1 Tax=Saccharata proteae CBS 121410 TaxID=1314787 RepID=A0A9P4HTB5_9PEZI|nr:hypothetical protein K490DRAFT_66689 [Saccharata proteae CBS 121410]